LPHRSTALQVLVIVFAHAVPAVTSAPTTFAVEPPQASVAVGAVKEGVTVHSIVVLALVPMVGGVVSTFRSVGGDSVQPALVLAVPPVVDPQSAASTYLVLI
jgi:hypothetical protein